MWPDNWTVLQLAIRVMSQLNVGWSTVFGFRYEVLPLLLDALAVPAADRLDVLDALRVIEKEVARKMNERS